MIGGDAFRNLHEDDQFRVRGALQAVVRSGESTRLRMRLNTVAGDVRRFEVMVHPVKEADGTIKRRGAGLARRHRAERAARSSSKSPRAPSSAWPRPW